MLDTEIVSLARIVASEKKVAPFVVANPHKMYDAVKERTILNSRVSRPQMIIYTRL